LYSQPKQPRFQNVRESGATVDLGDALLEGVAVGIGGFVRRWFAEHATEIDKVFFAPPAAQCGRRETTYR